jgi:hypothetical protein
LIEPNNSTAPCRNRCCPAISKDDEDMLIITDDYGGTVRINFLQLERLWEEAQKLK